jgi:uncharacterized phage-like protein YoqJ
LATFKSNKMRRIAEDPALTGKTCVAFIGHRPDRLGGYTVATFYHLRAAAISWLEAHPDTVALVGMGQGWDQAVASACVELNMPFIACIPFPDFGWRWPKEAQEAYNFLLGLAYKSVVISDAPYSSKKMMIAKKFMLDSCTRVVGMYDDRVKGPGATNTILEYAASKNLPVTNLYSYLTILNLGR